MLGAMAGDRDKTKVGYELLLPEDNEETINESISPELTIPRIATKSDSKSNDPLIGQVLEDRYRIARLLGKGNMARVYVAQQLSMQRNVAVKVLQPELVADEVAEGRFKQEVEAVSRLHSPHTIRFYDVGLTPDRSPFIAMELLAGQTLRERLDSEGAIAPDEVVSIVMQIAYSLQEAHEADVWHRDLKPGNVHFCHQPTPLQPFLKILDFGLAKLLDANPEKPTLTGQRQTVGTPAYMAPEAIVEERPVDHRIDIYAMGVMAFEMLTGTLPFNEKGGLQMAVAHVRNAIPSARERNPKLPADIDTFFLQTMAKDAAHRPPTAIEAAQILARHF